MKTGQPALLIIPRQPDCREWSMKLDLFMRIPTGISEVFDDFLDGSYLDKFDTVAYDTEELF